MPYATYSTPVNADMETIWELLLDKAEHPEKYIPYKVEYLKIHERFDNGLLREIKTPEMHMFEQITFDKDSGTVTFNVEKHPVYGGVILNKVSPGDDDSCGLPVLTFTMDVKPHSPELEQKQEAKWFQHAAQPEAIKDAVIHIKQLIEAEDAKRKAKGNKNFELIRKMFLTGEYMNVYNFVKFYHDDALYQFSNFPIVYGPQGIINASGGFLETVRNCYHHIKNMWEVDKDTVVVEMEVSYIRHNGKKFRLPVADTIRLKDGKVQELRIYMDISPVFAG